MTLRTATTRPVSALLAVCLLGLFAGASGNPDTLAQARAAVKRNMNTKEGQLYDSQVSAEFDEQTSSVIADCLKSAGEHPENFSLFIKMAKDGSVSEVLMDPPTQVAHCLRSAVLIDKFTPPPLPDYWVEAEITMKN